MSYKEKMPSCLKDVLVEFQEHIFTMMRGIALLIFHTNVSKFSRKLQLGFMAALSRPLTWFR